MKKGWIVKMVFFGLAAGIAMAAVVMWLWNWLIPELFHGPLISFWQAIGLMLLSRILFRGFYGMKNRGMHSPGWGRWKERMEKMSPEEREKMRELWKKRCGGWNCGDEKVKDEN